MTPTPPSAPETMLRRPADGVRALGIDPASVDQIILTHLHYDHAGSLGVMAIYPPPSAERDGIAVRRDVAPRAAGA